MNLDWDAMVSDARARLPFEQLLGQLGHAPQNGRFKSFSCPHCHTKGKAGLFSTQTGQTLFKCHWTSCPTGAKAMDEVQYLAFVTGQSREDGFVDYCRRAGVWEDREKFKKRACATENRQNTMLSTATFAPSPDTDGRSEFGAAPTAPEGAMAVETGRFSRAAEMRAEYGLDDEPESAEGENQMTGGLPDGKGIGGMALEALRWFHAQLTLERNDEDLLFTKRGIPTTVAHALGFKSNTRANLAIFQQMRQEFEVSALLESGLWCLKRETPQPNAQFFGWGRVGKAKLATANAEDWERDYADWEWCNPILIPYFDEKGELIHLRPHRGGAKGKMARLYVPRIGGRPTNETFSTVLVTEGEFKAAAVWGLARGRIGIAALPGIHMANNYTCREELETWLMKVRPQRVVIIYDHEEKANPSLPGFHPNKRKRHDPQIWAQYLAQRLHQRLRLTALVWDLPKEWQDANGKADFDGWLGRYVEAHQR